MFAYLNGTVADKEPNALVIDVGGIGFFCTASAMTVRKVGDIGAKAKVYTHMAVREEATELFCFSDKGELQSFKQLVSVSGVGPKAAIAILSELTPAQLAGAVAGGDYKIITSAQGVGPKLAQRILLELKGKLTDAQVTAGLSGEISYMPRGNEADALEALVSLGYQPTEAKTVIGNMNTKDMSAEDIIRMALKFLM